MISFVNRKGSPISAGYPMYLFCESMKVFLFICITKPAVCQTSAGRGRGLAEFFRNIFGEGSEGIVPGAHHDTAVPSERPLDEQVPVFYDFN